MIFLPSHQEQKLACEARARAGFSAYPGARESIENWDQVFVTVFALPRIAAMRPLVFSDADSFPPVCCNIFNAMTSIPTTPSH